MSISRVSSNRKYKFEKNWKIVEPLLKPKELQSQFTDLVDRIFSWQGWGMHDSGRGGEDFKALSKFLGPNGILLDCVYKLQLDQFLTFSLVKQGKFLWLKQKRFTFIPLQPYS